MEEARRALLHTVDAQLQMCAELLSVEPDAKWPLLTQTRLAQLRMELEPTEEMVSFQSSYERLAELDTMRRGYYSDAAEGKAQVPSVMKKA